MAARMPMIRMTTRSSMSVKPFSSLMRSRSFRRMIDPPWDLWSAAGALGHSRPGRTLVVDRPTPLGEPHPIDEESRLSLRPRLTTGLPLAPELWLCWVYRRVRGEGLIQHVSMDAVSPSGCGILRFVGVER